MRGKAILRVVEVGLRVERFIKGARSTARFKCSFRRNQVITKCRLLLGTILPAFCGSLFACNDAGHPALMRPDQSGVVTVDPAEVAAAEDAPEPEINARTYLAAGQFFESHGKLIRAKAKYHEAIGKDPNFVEAYHRLGVVAGMLGRHQEAEDAFRRAIQVRPSSASLRNNLGFFYYMQRRWLDAETEFRRAVSLDPQHHRARINLGLTLVAQGRTNEALKQFRWVLPRSDAYYNLGLACRAHRKFDEAADAFSKVLRLNPDFEAARRQLDSMAASGTNERVDASKEAANAIDDASPTTAHVDWSDIRATLDPAGAAEAQSFVGTRIDGDAKAGDSDFDGDMNGDGQVDRFDAAIFHACFAKLGNATSSQCIQGDFDGDQDVDLLDFHRFQAIYSAITGTHPSPSSSDKP